MIDSTSQRTVEPLADSEGLGAGGIASPHSFQALTYCVEAGEHERE